jgi:hypothetical protein
MTDRVTFWTQATPRTKVGFCYANQPSLGGRRTPEMSSNFARDSVVADSVELATCAVG